MLVAVLKPGVGKRGVRTGGFTSGRYACGIVDQHRNPFPRDIDLLIGQVQRQQVDCDEPGRPVVCVKESEVRPVAGDAELALEFQGLRLFVWRTGQPLHFRVETLHRQRGSFQGRSIGAGLRAEFPFDERRAGCSDGGARLATAGAFPCPRAIPVWQTAQRHSKTES